MTSTQAHATYRDRDYDEDHGAQFRVCAICRTLFNGGASRAVCRVCLPVALELAQLRFPTHVAPAPTPAMIEAGARALYEHKYGAMGGKWECVETKDVWHNQARAVLFAVAVPGGGA